MMIGRHDDWLVTTILSREWEWEWKPWCFFYSCYFYSGGWAGRAGRGSVTFQTSLQYTVHVRLGDFIIYCLINHLNFVRFPFPWLVFFTFIYNHFYSPSLIFIRFFICYIESLSAINIRQIYSLSAIFSNHLVQPSLTAICIRHLYTPY